MATQSSASQEVVGSMTVAELSEVLRKEWGMTTAQRAQDIAVQDDAQDIVLTPEQIKELEVLFKNLNETGLQILQSLDRIHSRLQVVIHDSRAMRTGGEKS